MVTNQSNKERTLYNQLSSRYSDLWTFDSTITYINYNNISAIQDTYILDEFRDYLEQEDYLEEVILDKKFYYSPAGFAEYYYGTPDLDFLVMYFSKTTTLFEFNRKKIKVLAPERLKDINKIILAYKDTVKDSKENPKDCLITTEFSELREVINKSIKKRTN